MTQFFVVGGLYQLIIHHVFDNYLIFVVRSVFCLDFFIYIVMLVGFISISDIKFIKSNIR